MSNPLQDLRAIKARIDALPPMAVALWVVDDLRAYTIITEIVREAKGNAIFEPIPVRLWLNHVASQNDRTKDAEWALTHGFGYLLEAGPALVMQMNKGPHARTVGYTDSTIVSIGRTLAGRATP